MKLKKINENYEDNEIFDKSLNKYARAKGAGNINKEISTGDPDKTDLPDRSGNQQAHQQINKDAKDLIGSSSGLKGKMTPKNLSSNKSYTI